MKAPPVRWQFLRSVWQGIRGNPLAMAGMITVAALCIVALAAPWLASFDPAQFDRGRILVGPSSAPAYGTSWS